MNYFIIAGEASGDLHGANLAHSIQNIDQDATIQAWGGDLLRKKGVTVTKDYKELAIMGFVEIVSQIPKILKNLKTATQEIISSQTDAVILVDFSGFNLRLAKKLRKQGYKGKIFYYISPKLWVWNAKRVNSFKKYIDAVFCILPFEVDFFQQHDYPSAFYIGNPIMDEISQFAPNSNFLSDHQLSDRSIIALLPGSRKNEINHVFSDMLAVVSNYPNHQFIVAGIPAVKELIDQKLQESGLDLPVIYNQTYDVMHHAKVAIVTSGTATLETALLNTPLILCYRTSPISYLIGKLLVKIDYIGLPNLILSKEMVKELIQNDLSKATIEKELNSLLNENKRIQQFKQDQKELKVKVGEAGASDLAAAKLFELLTN